MRSLVLILCFMCCSGCAATTLNKKTAYADAAAVIATSLALDAVNNENFDAVQVKTINAATFIKSLISLPEMADLPVTEVKTRVIQKANERSITGAVTLVGIIFSYVQQHYGTLSKIGTEGVIMLNASCDGVIRQASRMKKEWR
jgi:hypothetical protein